MNIVKAILSLLAALPAIAAAAGSNALLDQLQADHAALLAADRDFQQRRNQGELSATAAADYASYLQGLRRRVAADCLALVEAGSALPAGSPCGTFRISPAEGVPPEQEVPLNSVERTSILDAELEAGLSEFDEMLLREQQRIRASAPRTAHASAAQGGAGDGSGSAEGEQAGDSGAAGATGSSAAAGSASEAGPGEDAAGRPPGAGQAGEVAARGSGTQGQPPGIPDGSDDDVVARQLREAAEQETDPELQKKLWEEYRRYKQGIR